MRQDGLTSTFREEQSEFHEDLLNPLTTRIVFRSRLLNGFEVERQHQAHQQAAEEGAQHDKRALRRVFPLRRHGPIDDLFVDAPAHATVVTPCVGVSVQDVSWSALKAGLAR